jgi:protoporphyrinogen oxidase
MGLVSAASCLGSYLKEKVRPSFKGEENQTFESWVVGRFGRRLFNMFFKSYSEKLWGIPCSALDADFAAQRIKKFSLGQAVKAALGFGKKQHKTLVDQFAYPLGGTGMVYERMADRVRQLGGEVHLHQSVKRIVHEERQVKGLERADGGFEPFEHVISTMPLTLLVRGLGNLPPAVEQGVAALRFRNTILVYLNVAATELFKDQWLYIHSPDLGTGRVTNFRNWVPELYGQATNTILALEYWCYDEDEQWQSDDRALVELGEHEMRATGLLGDARVQAGHVRRIRRCYPVYARGYKKHLEPIMAYLRGFEGLSAIGRYGAFKYNNQDHSILMGLLAAENILEDRGHDLWAVNTDTTYQEAAVITKTGLQYPDGTVAPADSWQQPRGVPARV